MVEPEDTHENVVYRRLSSKFCVGAKFEVQSVGGHSGARVEGSKRGGAYQVPSSSWRLEPVIYAHRI